MDTSIKSNKQRFVDDKNWLRIISYCRENWQKRVAKRKLNEERLREREKDRKEKKKKEKRTARSQPSAHSYDLASAVIR